jgi:hypothetical protein
MGRRDLQERVGVVDLIGENSAPGFFLGHGERLTVDRVAIARTALEQLFHPYSVRNVAGNVAGNVEVDLAVDVAVQLTLVEPVIATSDANALITLAEVEEALYANIMVRVD